MDNQQATEEANYFALQPNGVLILRTFIRTYICDLESSVLFY